MRSGNTSRTSPGASCAVGVGRFGIFIEVGWPRLTLLLGGGTYAGGSLVLSLKRCGRLSGVSGMRSAGSRARRAQLKLREEVLEDGCHLDCLIRGLFDGEISRNAYCALLSVRVVVEVFVLR